MQKKYNITVDEEIGDRVDLYAKMNGLSRSAVYSIAANQYVAAMEQLPSLQAQLDELKNMLDELKPKKK